MVAVDATCQAHNRTTRILIPMRRTQTDEGRHHVAAVGIRNGFSHRLRLRRVTNQAQLITQPLNSSAGYENRTFQRILHLAVYAPGNRRHQTIFAVHRLFAGVHQHKAACTIGVLRLTGSKAGLSEESALLVACCTGDRNLHLKQLGVSRTVNTARRLNLRQHRLRNAQHRQNFFIPLQRVNIEHQGTRCVGIIRYVYLASGQLPDNPAVNRAEQQLACFCLLLRLRHILQNPMQLGAGKICVQHKAGLFTEHICVAADFQQVAILRSTAALPNNRLADRAACFLIPNHSRLTLIRDADAGNIRRSDVELAHRLIHQANLRRPDFLSIMLNPAGLRIILRKLLLRYTADFALLIKKNAAAARSAQVQSHNIFVSSHCVTTFPQYTTET